MDRQSGRSSTASAPDMGARQPPRTAGSDPADLPPPQAIKETLHRVGELREYVAYYLSARGDRIKLSLRRTAILAVLGIVALFAGGAVVVTSAVLLCLGLAQLIATGLNGRDWAGNLIVGGVILIAVGAGTFFLAWRLINASRKATVQKYELRQKRQRADFGHDVRQSAADGQSL